MGLIEPGNQKHYRVYILIDYYGTWTEGKQKKNKTVLEIKKNNNKKKINKPLK